MGTQLVSGATHIWRSSTGNFPSPWFPGTSTVSWIWLWMLCCAVLCNRLEHSEGVCFGCGGAHTHAQVAVVDHDIVDCVIVPALVDVVHQYGDVIHVPDVHVW
jgi:hypothetical protein